MGVLSPEITLQALRKALDGAAARQRVVAGNLANVETPGYRPRRVEFEQELQAALEAGDTQALQESAPTQRLTPGSPLRRDGNGVDVEREMAELAESGLHYQALTRLLARKLRLLESVATEGSRS